MHIFCLFIIIVCFLIQHHAYTYILHKSTWQEYTEEPARAQCSRIIFAVKSEPFFTKTIVSFERNMRFLDIYAHTFIGNTIDRRQFDRFKNI
jgi:hypothetical protein